MCTRRSYQKRASFQGEDEVSKRSLILKLVEISECDDVDVYVETVMLMYCDDLKNSWLVKLSSKSWPFLRFLQL